MATSSTFSTDNQYIKYNIVATESNVNASENTSKVNVQVKCWRTNTGYTTTGTGTVTCTINGTKYTASITNSQKITSSAIVLFNKTVTIKHSSDGSKTIYISASIKHSRFESGTNGFNVKLTTINTAPSAPTSFSIDASYGKYYRLGDTINLSWSGASGTITGYEIQYSRGSSGWKALKTVTGKSTTDKITTTDITQTGAGKKVYYRVRALNGSYKSAWKESNKLTVLGGMKINVNGTWKDGTVWINVNGTWKRAKCVWLNVNNTYKLSV